MLIDSVDQGLDVAPLKGAGHIDCFFVREDRLNQQGEFTLGNSTADQALQGHLRVENEGWSHQWREGITAGSSVMYVILG